MPSTIETIHFLSRKCIPIWFRRRVWEFIRNVQMARRIQESQRIPYYELQDKHIQNIKLLLNREELLKALPWGGTVAEIGVDEGAFTERILSVTKPTKLHLIDLWGSERYHSGKVLTIEDKFREHLRQGTVEINRGYSTEVLGGFSDGYFDWIYIDSDHGYSVTADELHLGCRKIKTDGFIGGHDYVTGNWKTGVRYGVIEAVHEFCVKENWELCFLTTETHQHRSFAIRKIT